MTTTTDSNLWTANEVKVFLGYRNTSAFWAFVHASGVPYLQMNARRIMFHRPALEAWLRRRAVGKHEAPIVQNAGAAVATNDR